MIEAIIIPNETSQSGLSCSHNSVSLSPPDITSEMPTEQSCYKWKNLQEDMIKTFNQLLSKEAMVDVTLVCEGKTLKAHKLVLSASSTLFHDLFMQNPNQHSILILQETKYSELKSIIDFIYKGVVCIPSSQQMTLLKTAEALKINGLINAIKEKELVDNPATNITRTNFTNIINMEENSASHLVSQETKPSRKRPLSCDNDITEEIIPDRKQSNMMSSTINQQQSQYNSPLNKSEISVSKDTDLELVLLKKNEIVVETAAPTKDNFNDLSDLSQNNLLQSSLNRSKIIKKKILPCASHNTEEVLQNRKGDDSPLIFKEIASATNVMLHETEDTISQETGFNLSLVKNEDISIEETSYAECSAIEIDLDIKQEENSSSQVSSNAYTEVSNAIRANTESTSTNIKQVLVLNENVPSILDCFPSSSTSMLPEAPLDKNMSKVRQFECEICKKIFTRNDQLIIHLSSHMEEQPFTCNICHQNFSHLSIFQKHMKIHSETYTKTHSCCFCQRTFSQFSMLQEHLKIHTGEKPYQCDFCEKKFAQIHYLNDHIRLHTGENPFPCEICYRCFRTKANLSRHLSTHRKQ